MRRFRALAVGARGLPQHRCIAGDIQQIILDLECKADGIRKPRQRAVETRIQRRRAFRRHEDAGLDDGGMRSEEHTSELQSRQYLVCRLLLEKKKKKIQKNLDTVI